MLGDPDAWKAPGALKPGEKQFVVTGAFFLVPDRKSMILCATHGYPPSQKYARISSADSRPGNAVQTKQAAVVRNTDEDAIWPDPARVPGLQRRVEAQQAQDIEQDLRAVVAVLAGGVVAGAPSTTSPPTRLRPLKPRSSASTSRLVRAPISGVPEPGAKAGSSASMSNDR